MKFPRLIVWLMLIALSRSAFAQTTIVAFGDSTTAARPGVTVYSQLLAQELPGEGSQYTIINAGVGGNTTAMAAARFEKDVLAAKPQIVVIQFGINDAAIDVWKNPPVKAPRVDLREYQQNLTYFITELKNRRIRPILMTPNPLRWTDKMRRMYGKPPYRPEDPEGFDFMVAQYAQSMRAIAEKNHVEIVDVRQAFITEGADKLLPDGIHPNDAGHRLVADLLKAVIAGNNSKRAGKLPEQSRIDPRDPQSPLILGAAPKGRPIRVPDGSLWSFSNQRIEGTFAVVRSTDGGKTWGDPKPGYVPPAGSSPAGLLAVDRDGEVHAVFLVPRGKGKPAVDFFLDLWHVRTTDQRARWSAPQRIWEGYCGAILDFQILSSGRLVAPFAAWKKPGEQIAPDTGSNYTLAVYSDDGGATWRQSPSKLTSPCHEGYNGNNYGAIEPTILELKDHSIWMLMRTQTGFLYESTSRDGAEWTPARPSRFASSTSPAALVRMSTGRIVNIWNNCQMPPKAGDKGVYGGRDALHAAYSDDEGRTWRGFREIYRDPFRNDTPPRFGDRGTAYPVATPIDEHTLAIATGQGDRRTLLLLDDRWLQAVSQSEDFSAGLAAWHVWKPFGVVERYWRDRIAGAALIDHPDKPGAKALHIRRPDARDADTAIWNFPAGASGKLSMRFRLPRGSAGASISLADRFFDPNDPAAAKSSMYALELGEESSGKPLAVSLDLWHTLWINFDGKSALFSLDGKSAAAQPIRAPYLHGISYLRLRSLATAADPAGLMVESVSVEVQPPSSSPPLGGGARGGAAR